MVCMISTVICNYVTLLSLTPVICHVFMHCLGSFPLQDMFISLQEFVLRDKI